MNLNLNNLKVTWHALKRYEKYYIKLYGNNEGLILTAEHLRQILRESQQLEAVDPRNPQARRKRYPDAVYFRHDRIVFVVDDSQNKLIICFPFAGRKARHSKKPKTRDRRAREKEEHRRKVSPFLG